MPSIVSRLRIQTLKVQIEASRQQGLDLAQKFETATSNEEKAKIARKHARALKQTHALQLMLEVLERKEREAGDEAGETASSQ